MLLLILSVALFSAHSVTPVLTSKIEPRILTTLQSNKNVTIVITFESATPTVISMQAKNFGGRTQKISAIKDTLESFASNKQKPVVNFLKSLDNSTNTSSTKNSAEVSYKSFWVSNMIVVNNADLTLIKKLSEFESVKNIAIAPVINFVKPVGIRKNSTTKMQSGNVVWGVKAVGGDEAWKLGYTGRGIVVGSIDSGARYTHEIIRDNYVNNGYGWYDPVSGSNYPADINGHGTHTIGTIVGKNGYGLAPDAKWMSCRAMNEKGQATMSDIVACLQFMICPTNPQGYNGDCSKAPHIISNSWAFGFNGMDNLNGIIWNFHAAGIIPVFASGNEGPYCGTTKSPGDTNVISVGSVSSNDTLSRFSSKGPGGFYSETGPKPDIVAPGEDIMSADIKSDYSYITMDGTSMATPLVSGAVALILQMNEDLSYESVRRYLFQGAETNVDSYWGDSYCGGTSETVVPNNLFGHGRLNILQSLNLVKNTSSVLKSLSPISIFSCLFLCLINFIQF